MWHSVKYLLFKKLFSIPYIIKNNLLNKSLVYQAICINGTVFMLRANNVNCIRFSHENSNCKDLCQVCRFGNIKDLRRLIEQGENPNCRHELGWMPIHSAVSNNELGITRYLISKGADVNARDEFPGVYKLSARRHYNQFEVSQIRSEDFGTNFGLMNDYSGFTPLHYAVFQENKDMIKLLIENGADITNKNDAGQTPVDLALTSDIRSYLEEEIKKAKIKEREEQKRYPLDAHLKKYIVGQLDAINTVSSAIRRLQGGWIRGDKPLVFLFLGSSGVGKTELAKQLANYLHKDKRCFIRIDMSEYQNKHEVSKFIGAPPGYVGYDQGGQLTSSLRQCPNAVVLFDEIEKAHPDVITVMLQLFDEGRITDGQGQTVNCPEAIFVMTSNLASEEIAKYASKLRSDKPVNSSASSEITVSKQFKSTVIYPILKRHLHRDEFLGRINEMVYFLPFDNHELIRLVEIELNFWANQALKNHKIKITWESDLPSVLADGYDIHYGARSLKYEVEKRIVNTISSLNDEGKLENGSKLHISVDYGSQDAPLQTPKINFDVKKSSWFG